MQTPNSFRVYFINFHYHSAQESSTLDEAKKVAKSAGFQSVIEENGRVVASFCPVGGFHTIR